MRGNWGWAVLVTLINMVVAAILAGSGHALDKIYIDLHGSLFFMAWMSPSGTILGWISSFCTLSVAISLLKLRDKQKEEKVYLAAFSVFTESRFGPELINYILTSIFTFLWTLLLFIPGIVKSYSYAMTPYIVQDMVASGKQVGATDGINASRELMNGHKMDLFIFDLSFLGWGLLAGLTFGIGLLWLVPYYQTSKANFYRNLAGDKFLK